MQYHSSLPLCDSRLESARSPERAREPASDLVAEARLRTAGHSFCEQRAFLLRMRAMYSSCMSYPAALSPLSEGEESDNGGDRADLVAARFSRHRQLARDRAPAARVRSCRPPRPATAFALHQPEPPPRRLIANFISSRRPRHRTISCPLASALRGPSIPSPTHLCRALSARSGRRLAPADDGGAQVRRLAALQHRMVRLPHAQADANTL